MKYDYPTAFAAHGPEELAAAQRVLASGRLTAGPEVDAFEAELAVYHGRKHAIMTNSGSSANLVAVAALRRDIKTNYDVLVPAIAWATTYAPLIQYDLGSLVVSDVDDTWNVPISRTPTMIGTSLIVAVPVLGNPAYLSQWQADADYHGIPLFVDNCESMGSMTRDGIPTGTYGTIATLSFFYSHQLSAYEGGAALTDDDDLARTMRLLVGHGNSGWGTGEFESSYRFELFGYNLRPVEMHAAIGRVQLRKLADMVEQRRANATLFREMTAGLPIVHPRIEGQPSPFGLAFTVESTDVRRRLVAALRDASIDARLPTGGSFTRHPYGAPWRDQPTPNADRIHDTGMFLGNAPYAIPGLIERAVKVMRNTL